MQFGNIMIFGDPPPFRVCLETRQHHSQVDSLALLRRALPLALGQALDYSVTATLHLETWALRYRTVSLISLWWISVIVLILCHSLIVIIWVIFTKGLESCWVVTSLTAKSTSYRWLDVKDNLRASFLQAFCHTRSPVCNIWSQIYYPFAFTQYAGQISIIPRHSGQLLLELFTDIPSWCQWKTRWDLQMVLFFF